MNAQSNTPPDSTYTTFFNNGYIWPSLDVAPEGAIPLFLYFNAGEYHHATVASPAGLYFVSTNGFTLLSQLGYVLPPPE